MTTKEMDILTAHFDSFFMQGCDMLLHPIVMEPHIDVLLYEPNEEFPFWKMVTLGASDFKMPSIAQTLGNRNEYMIFINKDIDLKNADISSWYCNKLLEIALYPINGNFHVTYGHSIEWGEEDNEEMVSAFITLPQIIPNPRIVKCKTGLFKTVTCLQAVSLNRSETEKLLAVGSSEFDEYLYPEDGSEKHFLFERKRSEKF